MWLVATARSRFLDIHTPTGCGVCAVVLSPVALAAPLSVISKTLVQKAQSADQSVDCPHQCSVQSHAFDSRNPVRRFSP